MVRCQQGLVIACFSDEKGLWPNENEREQL